MKNKLIILLIFSCIISCDIVEKDKNCISTNVTNKPIISDSIISEKIEYGIEVLTNIDTVYSISEIEYYLIKHRVDKTAIFIGEIKNLESFQNLMYLYFLKIFENKLVTKSYELSNLSCCYMQSGYMMIFIRQYYECSGYDPTASLIIDDIYSWICHNKETITNEIVYEQFIEIENIKI